MPALLGAWPLTRLWYRSWGLRLDGAPGDVVWYFAYGANMHASAFRDRRGMRPDEARAGRIAGYRLRFNLDGWPRGRSAPANISPDPDSEVGACSTASPGANWSGSTHPKACRAAATVPFLLAARDRDGEALEAFAYIARGKARDGRPSLRYITLIREGARAHGLPPHWLARLEAVSHADEDTGP